jgi:hypothetical protein
VYRHPAVVAAEEAQREAARDGHRQLWAALMAGAREQPWRPRRARRLSGLLALPPGITRRTRA